MGKPIKIFEQRKGKIIVIENFNTKNDIVGGQNGRVGGQSVAQNNPCKAIRAPTHVQSIRTIVK